MKKLVLFSVFILTLAAGLRADDGCDKASDACKPQIKKLTPFMAALNKAQTAPALNQGLTEEASLNQGGPKAQLAASATPTVAAAPGESKNEKTISHPSWLLAIAGLLAGLYYFLKEGKKKGKA